MRLKFWTLRPSEAKVLTTMNHSEIEAELLTTMRMNDSDKKHKTTANCIFNHISHPCFQISKSKISLKILRFTPCMLDQSASALPALHDSIIKTGYIIESKKFL